MNEDGSQEGEAGSGKEGKGILQVFREVGARYACDACDTGHEGDAGYEGDARDPRNPRDVSNTTDTQLRSGSGNPRARYVFGSPFSSALFRGYDPVTQ